MPPVVQAAVADLAGRLGLAGRLDLPGSGVTVVQVAEVVWRDGSLGCPRPGLSYVQALTPGTLVVLEAGGRRYEYHAAAGRAPFLCDDPLDALRDRLSTQSDENP